MFINDILLLYAHNVCIFVTNMLLVLFISYKILKHWEVYPEEALYLDVHFLSFIHAQTVVLDAYFYNIPYFMNLILPLLLNNFGLIKYTVIHCDFICFVILTCCPGHVKIHTLPLPPHVERHGNFLITCVYLWDCANLLLNKLPHPILTMLSNISMHISLQSDKTQSEFFLLRIK